MKIGFANSAFVDVPQRFVQGGGTWHRVPLRVRYGVLERADGIWLVDTGIGPAALTGPRGTILRLYGAILGYRLVQQRPLAAVRGVILTHFHADHVAGLGGFPGVPVVADGAAFAGIQRASAFKMIRQGVFQELLPADLGVRLHDIAAMPHVDLPFGLGQGNDVFGDGSCLSLRLPGHAAGHFGLVFPYLPRPLLYACDTAWTLAGLDRPPGWPAHLFVQDKARSRESAALVNRWRAAGGDVVLCHDPTPTPWDMGP